VHCPTRFNVCKIERAFEHYAAQSEYYKRANVAQRFMMEDSLPVEYGIARQDYWAVRSHAVIVMTSPWGVSNTENIRRN